VDTQRRDRSERAESVLLVIRLQSVKLTSMRILIMFGIVDSVLSLLALVVLAGAVFGLRHYYSANAREARRRARSHGPVVSRKRGPSVRLAVAVDKPKRRRKR